MSKASENAIRCGGSEEDDYEKTVTAREMAGEWVVVVVVMRNWW